MSSSVNARKLFCILGRGINNCHVLKPLASFCWRISGPQEASPYTDLRIEVDMGLVLSGRLMLKSRLVSVPSKSKLISK